MADLATILAAITGGGGVTLLVQTGKAWLDARGSRQANDVKMEEHKDQLTFDLLAAAREEVAAARVETQGLRPLVARLAHFEEALDHIEALLHSDTTEELAAAKRRARAFLNRMRRLAEAKGTIINEVQRAASGAALTKHEGNEP